MTIVINGDSVKISLLLFAGGDQAAAIEFPAGKFKFDFLMVII
jgi:hypothetical protein